jgi:hypothetical protein
MNAPKDFCLESLLYLKFAMSGDVASGELLRQLLERFATIEWDSPQFLADLETMRSCEPVTPPQLPLGDIAHSLLEICREVTASEHEALASMRSALHIIEKGFADFEIAQKQAKYASGLVNYTYELIDLHKRMRDRLNSLGVDTSEYEAPEPPKFKYRCP